MHLSYSSIKKLDSFFPLFPRPCRNTRWSSCSSSSGTIRGCGTRTSPRTSFWTRSTTTRTSGCRTRTSSCTATLRIRSSRCTLRCGYSATVRSIISWGRNRKWKIDAKFPKTNFRQIFHRFLLLFFQAPPHTVVSGKTEHFPVRWSAVFIRVRKQWVFACLFLQRTKSSFRFQFVYVLTVWWEIYYEFSESAIHSMSAQLNGENIRSWGRFSNPL